VGGTISYTDQIGAATTSFSYRVKAINVVGDTWDYADPALNEIVSGGFPTITTESSYTNAATWPETPPATPSFLTATSSRLGAPAGQNLVRLSWQNVANETGYNLQRATNAAFTANVVTIDVGAAAAGNTVQYVDTVARGTPGVTRYYYRVQSERNATVSGWSPTASVTTR
jgi:hypothetical protein